MEPLTTVALVASLGALASAIGSLWRDARSKSTKLSIEVGGAIKGIEIKDVKNLTAKDIELISAVLGQDNSKDA